MQQVWLSASKPTFSIHCKHLESTCLVGQKEKLSSGLAKPSQASTSLSRQIHQWLGSRKTSHPYTKGILDKNYCLAVNPSGTIQNMRVLVFVRLSFHVVGKVICLVILWPNPARRDKPWNYIPPEFQRYTKLILATGNLYGHVENIWGIPFPKRIK